MEIGDRVRLLHGKEEGIIRRFIDAKTVEVEIEDGFLIPVLKNELVTIDRGETESFKLEERSNVPEAFQRETGFSEESPEVFLAVEIKNTNVDLWLINLTENLLLFTAHALSNAQYRGLSYGTLPKYTYSKIDSWSLKEQDQWPLLVLDILPYQQKGSDPGLKISKRLTLKASQLMKKKEKAPLLNLEVALIRLAEEIKIPDPDTLKEAFFAASDVEIRKKDHTERSRDEEVDLHIESLVKDTHGMSNENILKIQMEYFEKKLERAVIGNVRSVTFIHGIGNGTLRNKIHKFLSQYPHIKYYEDARKEKFGYGATKVFLK
jgi:DNA-nicking Smr family endonuclease